MIAENSKAKSPGVHVKDKISKVSGEHARDFKDFQEFLTTSLLFEGTIFKCSVHEVL